MTGKGIEYYKNGDIKYEGDFVDGKRERKGKYIDKDGTYNGEWLNDLMNGKGILNYNNGNKYEGDFVNGKFEGKGKFSFEDGE